MKKLMLTTLSIVLSAGTLTSAAVASELNRDTVANTVATSVAKAKQDATVTNSIASLAAHDSRLSTLAIALEATQLNDRLSSEGPFTLFAPSNAAFAALPEGTLERLLDPANLDELKAILSYHIVEGTVTSTNPVGQQLSIMSSEKGFKVNGANIISEEIKTKNGIVHIIDAVLVPTEQ